METGKRLANKVLLIGWDAADWQMIHPLIAEGKMPALKRLIDNGVSGNLATIRPILSPMLWTSIATGKRPDKHGIHGFLEPLPDGTNVRPVTSGSRTCKTIWNILNQSGMRSNVIGWYATYPAEPINGAMVANSFPYASRDDTGKLVLPKNAVHPPELFEEIAELHVRGREISPHDVRPLIPQVDEIDVAKDDKPLQLAILLAAAASTQAAATHLMAVNDWDFTAVYFPAVDHFGHHFIDFHPPKQSHVSDRDFELYKHVMNGCYMFHDMLLNAMLQQVDDDTTVIIVSDHGFYTGEHRPPPQFADKDPEIMHRHLGIACLHGPGIKQDEKLYGATLLDVTPTILSLFGLPVGLDMDGRPWQEILDRPSKINSVLSWEWIDGDAGLLPHEQVPTDIQGSEEAIQQLVDLGYIEPLSKDVQESVQKCRKDLKINLVKSLMDSVRFKNAIPILEEITEQNETNLRLKIMLAECFQRDKQTEKAQAIIGKLDESVKQTSDVLVLMADIAFSQNKLDKALEHIIKAQQHNPQSPRIACTLGKAYLKIGKINEAKEAFTKSLEIEPDYAFAHCGLSSVNLVKENYEKAADHALEAITIIPHFPEAHFNLGLGLLKMEKNAEAIIAFESCEKMAFKLNKTYFFLAKLHKKTDPPKAQHYLNLIEQLKAKSEYYFADE